MMASAVSAQQEQTGQAQQAAQGQEATGAKQLDKLFLKQTAVDNTFEIQLSQLAEQKAQDQKVKQFAQMLVQDHQQAKQQLQQVAQKNQVQLPNELPEMKQEELSAYRQLQGSEFDQAYLSCMKVAHAKAVAQYEEKSQHAKIPEVKQFAQQTLPKLRQHKQQVVAMTGGGDEAQPAGSRQHNESDRQTPTGSQPGSSSGGTSTGSGTSSSGTGSRETGSGITTGSGTTGAGSTGGTSGGGSR